MRRFNIPNYGEITIENIIFDLNGTLQFKGKISKELIKKIKELKKNYNVYIVSSDIRGNLKDIAEKLGVNYIKVSSKEISEAELKNNELTKLGKDVTVTVGNGNNDSLMLKNSLLGLVIIGNEGASIESITNSDVAFADPICAIDFLIDEKILIGTLRS